jgi:hypothetical protein
MSEEIKYKYPVGDFLSGFSDDETNPCDYELECQRMVVKGVEYFDDNQEMFDIINGGGKNVFDPELEPLVNHMIAGGDGQTGAMVGHTVKHAFYAKKLGWDNYISKITKKDE